MSHTPTAPRLRALLLPLFLGGAAHAQATPPPDPAPPPAVQSTRPDSLSAILAALRRAPEWRSADLAYRAAQLVLDSARTRAGLSLTAGATASLVKIPWDTGTWNASTTLNISGGLSVLPWSAAQEGLRSAERTLGTAAITLRSTRAALTLQTLQAYAAAHSAAENVATSGQQVTIAARQLAIATDQRANGLIPPEALLGRQVALENAQAAQARATRAAQQAARTLAHLLGAPVTLPAQPDDYAPLPQVPVGTNVDDLVRRAQARRPEVGRARAALADAQAAVTAARLDARFPDLTASVSAGQLADANGNSGTLVSGSFNLKAGTLGAQASLPLRDTSAIPSGLSLSLTASIPLLGRAADPALAQAELAGTQAQLALDSALQSTELDVRSKFDALQDEQAALTGAQTGVAQARAALDSARARLDAGLGTALDVRTAELNLQQATQALRAQQDAVTLATLQLAQATTDLDPLLLTSGGTP